ncbi:lytic murein transglycosylase [Sphingomonas sp.]|uniref:lytic murein transglycosylase n=1 Tax=Sphingomonas sp. TaxID=28214 RepID=UPI00286DDB34|nr:lytic murein transglycosylase [Sphingomonas sp.]
MRSISGWTVVALAGVAFGPASAQVDLGPPQPVRVVPAQLQPRPPGYTQVYPAQPYAPQPLTGFAAYKVRLAALARQAGVREATIQAYVPSVNLSTRAMQLDRSQPTGNVNSPYISPFAPYRARHVTASLINRGQARYYAHWTTLRQVEARYGVDPAVAMAIYGHETSYGQVTGNFDLLEALASLAYEGRRRAFFEAEFVAALKLIDGGIARSRLRGSYAGATGYPQFMPSVALRLRADGDGDGYANIWTNEADALASIGNYLRDAGWKRGLPWGVAVRTPSGLNRAAIRSTLNTPRCPAVFRRHSRWLTMREWRALGVAPYGRTLPEAEMATLIEPDGPSATAYLLTSNYRTILDYNCSNFYALSVGLLADAIARR